MCSVKSDADKLAGIVYRVVAFYKGGLSIEAANTIPLPQLFEAEYYAGEIAEENRQAANKK